MEVWIKQGDEKIQLPVLPSSIEIQAVQNNQTVAINKIGEINLFGKRGLKSFSLSSFFPQKKNKYGSSIIEYSNFKKPYEYVKILEKWKEADICQVVITGMLNTFCTIEAFSYSETDGTGDVYYTIDFKEYVKIKTKSKNKKKETINKKQKTIKQVEENRNTKKVKSTTYVVKKGDTLSEIAKKLTGNSGNYIAIANQNNIKNPNKIFVGQKLVIKV